jgi:hypothetical protein
MKLSLKLPARFAPREPRAAVAIEATLLLPDDSEAPISIKNISADGFMGEASAQIAADAWIGVALPGCGIMPALVRWNTGDELGAQFRRPLDLERLQRDPGMDTPEGTLFRSRILHGPF